MIVCPACGQGLRPEQTSCPHCRAMLPSAPISGGAAPNEDELPTSKSTVLPPKGSEDPEAELARIRRHLWLLPLAFSVTILVAAVLLQLGLSRHGDPVSSFALAMALAATAPLNLAALGWAVWRTPLAVWLGIFFESFYLLFSVVFLGGLGVATLVAAVIPLLTWRRFERYKQLLGRVKLAR